MVPAKLKDIIKVEYVIGFIANENVNRMICQNKMIISNISDKIDFKSREFHIQKTAYIQDSVTVEL